MIAEFGADSTRPKVARFNGKVAVYAVDDGSNHGFLLPDAAAVDTATKMLAAVADLNGDVAFSHVADSMKFQVVHQVGRDSEGLLTFRLNGAPVSISLDMTQVAELAAAFAVASKSTDDRGGPPRNLI